jgi:hypothetical protein
MTHTMTSKNIAILFLTNAAFIFNVATTRLLTNQKSYFNLEYENWDNWNWSLSVDTNPIYPNKLT